jgi:hypothetical protein
MNRIGKHIHRLVTTVQHLAVQLFARHIPRTAPAPSPQNKLPGHAPAEAVPEGKGYGPNMATITKLEKLRTLRRESIRNGRVMLTWTAACRQIAIDPKTARHHEPELRAHWDDPTYM